MIFGFDDIKDNLLNLFHKNRLHHCNLLYGDSGVGKNTFITNVIAPIILNNGDLENTKNLILSGGHTDFLRLDIRSLGDDNKINVSKKGEINVSQTRRIINEIRMTPSISKYKLLVIDSIDILNLNSQNVLLKTIEEPPKNTFIFLACNNIDKTLPTIRSRSNIIRVPKLNIDNWSNAILNNEISSNTDLDEESLFDLYNLSNQSVSFALDIIRNNSINMYDNIIDLILNLNILEIQNFVNCLSDDDKYFIFCSFINKLFSDLIHYSFDDSFFYNNKRNDKFILILNKININIILKQYDNFIKLVNDIDIYNLDRKLSFNIFFNNFI